MGNNGGSDDNDGHDNDDGDDNNDDDDNDDYDDEIQHYDSDNGGCDSILTKQVPFSLHTIYKTLKNDWRVRISLHHIAKSERVRKQTNCCQH